MPPLSAEQRKERIHALSLDYRRAEREAQRVRRILETEVRKAREHDVTWEQIGQALGYQLDRRRRAHQARKRFEL